MSVVKSVDAEIEQDRLRQARELGREQPCPARGVPVATLDALVWDDLCQVLTQPQNLTTAVSRAQRGAWLPQELQARCTAHPPLCSHRKRTKRRLAFQSNYPNTSRSPRTVGWSPQGAPVKQAERQSW